MPKLTFYPIGNADCCVAEFNERIIVFDYANMRNPEDPADRRIDLENELRTKLAGLKKTSVDVLALTHLDRDHIKGVHVLFHFEHAEKYQEPGSILVDELWVPACAIIEDGVDDDARIVRQEARHRLIEGKGIRVFSRPEVLEAWLKTKGIALADRRNCFVDAGQLVPGFTLNNDGLEVFVHSPFASRLDNGELMDRNTDSILVQLTCVVDGVDTKVLLASDADYECLSAIVDVTRYHGHEARLEWDVLKLPHHCSYLTLGPEKGVDKTQPVERVAWLFGDQSRSAPIVVSPSYPIPLVGDDVQPPHRQAANYYRGVVASKNGKFIVTMEHPNSASPKPLIIEIDSTRARVIGLTESAVYATVTQAAPRAGH